MNFISLEFAVFVAAALIFYYLCPFRFRWIVLLGANLLFFADFSVWYLPFLLFTAATTYAAARVVERSQKHRKLPIVLCLAANIGIWFVVKDYHWAASLLQRMFAFLTLPTLENLIVPVGISYYTLQSIGYLIDVYRGEKAERNFFRYTLFLSWFPAIVQGPISRYHDLAPQFQEEHRFRDQDFSGQLLLILFGVIKKVVIADQLARVANYCFDNYETLGFFQLYLGAIAFSIQLYMDFSGCVDICRGSSGLFGIHLQQNFSAPYFSRSIAEFWRKWHISLSSWLRDYVYIPLGGNRKGTVRKYINVVLVFLVSGLWHGAGGHFLVWGLIHGLYQVIGAVTAKPRNRLRQVLGIQKDSTSEKIYQTVITFHLVALGWIFFRAPGISEAIGYLTRMFTNWNPWALADGSLYALGLGQNLFRAVTVNILLVFLVDFLHTQKKDGLRKGIQSLHIGVRWAVYFVMIYDVLLFGAYGAGVDPAAFLYGGF